MKKETDKRKGIMIPKIIFEGYTKGFFNAQEFSDLMMAIYDYSFNDIEPNLDVMGPHVSLGFIRMKDSLDKSKANAKYYQKNKNNK